MSLFMIKSTKLVERDTEKILHLNIYKHEFFTICSLRLKHLKTIPGHFKFGHFQDGRQITKMADISLGSVCDKLIKSQFLFSVEQQIWYQIEAKLLSLCVKFKYAN